MNLQDRMNRYKQGMTAKAPEDALAVMKRSTEDLKSVYLRFGLKVHEHNGDDTRELPMPARLIVDTQGVIRYSEINPDCTVRPEPAETLAALDGI